MVYNTKVQENKTLSAFEIKSSYERIFNWEFSVNCDTVGCFFVI